MCMTLFWRSSKKAALLISNVIKKELGIALSAEEINAEEALKKAIKDLED